MPPLKPLPRHENDSDQLELTMPTRSLDSLIVDPAIVRSLKVLKLEISKRGELARNGLAPRHKLLLYGPPGNGKTATTEALAAMLDLPLYTARWENLTNCYVGDSEKAVVKAFKAVEGKACVLFFDEADTLLSARFEAKQSADIARNSQTNLCLQHLDRLDNRVLFVAATNRFDDLDPAVKRRFDEKIEFAPPTDAQKQLYIERSIATMPVLHLKKFAAMRAAALRVDAPSFAEIEHKLKQLARECILKDLMKKVG